MPDTLAKELLTSLKQKSFVRAGSRIGVAVSGGADSVALLLLLLEIRESLGLVLSVAHLNHQLRGKSSDADEAFVAKLAAKHKLPFYGQRLDIAAKARREKSNLEEAARGARYDFFRRLIAEGKLESVAVAHTADDQAETVLAHILRGTGLAGLGGIYPETDCVFRPLLHVRRLQLRSYLRSKKQKWREDATNRDTSRLRARIREKLLPLLEKQFQPAVVEHLVSLAKFAREDEAFLDWLAAERCRTLPRKTAEETRIALQDLLNPLPLPLLDGAMRLPAEALTKRILRRLINESKTEKHKSPQTSAHHIAAVLHFAHQGENGKTLQLPGGVDVRRERNALAFRSRPSSFPDSKSRARNAVSEAEHDYQHLIEVGINPLNLRVPQAGCVFCFTAIDWPANRGETRTSGAVLDRSRLRFPLVLRNWRPGDKLQPAGHQRAHKLKRLLNEKRISRWDRRGWPVLTSDGIVIWARGFPVASSVAPGKGTREALMLDERKL